MLQLQGLREGAQAPVSVAHELSFMAFDFGLKRIGVAHGNRITGTAQPLLTISGAPLQRWAAISGQIECWQPQALVVGVPYYPDGTPHDNTLRAERFIRQLHGRFHLKVFAVDERYSTTEARAMHAEDVDSVSAAIILEQFFNECACRHANEAP